MIHKGSSCGSDTNHTIQLLGHTSLYNLAELRFDPGVEVAPKQRELIESLMLCIVEIQEEDLALKTRKEVLFLFLSMSHILKTIPILIVFETSCLKKYFLPSSIVVEVVGGDDGPAPRLL